MKVGFLFSYFSEVKLEFSKVVWLKPKELGQLLITVLVATILAACLFTVIDMISQSLIVKVIFM